MTLGDTGKTHLWWLAGLIIYAVPIIDTSAGDRAAEGMAGKPISSMRTISTCITC
jgi:hypothetical protein